ncbi:response regulator [Pseudaquabacterium rugosum]|uniref:histidine kinase n=1 Tax=Pseudaquabacterium rugosum TaxID=2984194 RepID=A0ABU9BF22_9BURK
MAVASTLPRVLLVDDDPGAIHVLHRLLEGRAQVRYALDGAAALALAADWQPELVLLDAQMPDLPGSEVCRRLKADPATAAVPVLMVTALDAAGAALLALEAGADGVLGKPVDAAALWRRLDALVAPAGAADAADTDPHRPRLLIVDDDPAAVQLLHAALQDLPAHFQFAGDGAQALALARRQLPDLILLDLYMPGLDGLATLRALKALAREKGDPGAPDDLQVIVVTRFDDPDMEARALQAGGVDFIGKPYSRAVLQARVRNVLQLQRQARAMRAAERAHGQRLGDARLAQVVAAAPDGIVVADAAGRVVLANAAACALFGHDAAWLIGRPLTALLPMLALPPDDGQPSQHRQRLSLHEAPGADAQTRIVEVAVARLARGAEALTTIVLRDLAQTLRAEAADRARGRAEAALQAKRLMLSYVAHEIGNPLTHLLHLGTLLNSQAPHLPDARRDELLAHMADTGQQLRALMGDVLDLHRLESGRFEVLLQRVDAHAALRHAIEVCGPAAQGRAITLHLQAPADGGPDTAPLWVRADATRLRQCLVNLLDNAVKFNRDGGQVRLQAGRDGSGEAWLAIEDQGPGLTAPQRARLFEPFERLGQEAVRGTGLGLALTRQLVQAMGGRLDVDSTPGQGSRFSLTLQALADDPSHAR